MYESGAYYFCQLDQKFKLSNPGNRFLKAYPPVYSIANSYNNSANLIGSTWFLTMNLTYTMQTLSAWLEF